MSGYSAVSKIAMQQTFQTTNSIIIDQKQINHQKLIAEIKDLFDHISSNTVFSSNIRPLSSVFLQLTNICQNLFFLDRYTASSAFENFHFILTNYIKLLDNDRFVDAICHDHFKQNHDFLHALYRVARYAEIHKMANDMTMKNRREIFFSLFDQLHSSKMIRTYLENYEETHEIIINSCSFVLYTVLYLTNVLLIPQLTNNDLEKYDLNLLIRFVDEYFIKKEHLRINPKQNARLINEILAFIWNTTDNTLTIPIFINANFAQIGLRWLSLSYLERYQYKACINIFINIARHDEGANILKKYEAEKIIRQFKDKTFNEKIDFVINQARRSDKFLRIFALLFVLVVDPDEMYNNKINRDSINQVLSLNHIDPPFWNGACHISEPLIAIMKLCTNDHIIDYILQQDQYQMYFYTVLKTVLTDIENKKLGDNDLDLHVSAIIALANILWSISFHHRYKNHLLQNINLIKQLETFRENEILHSMLPHIHIPHQMSSLRRTIDGIYQNLYPLSPSKLENPSTIRSIMISYSHVNMSFCRQLNEVLSQFSELTINIDINNGKYLWKDIAETIHRSNLILVLISKDYFYSKSCRQELLYMTDILRKPIVPIFIDLEFQATGWLQQRIGCFKYVRFSGKDFLSSCEELLELINSNLCMTLSFTNNSLNVSKWNENEVKQWFKDNKIVLEIKEFYNFENGNELSMYAKGILKCSWMKEYERIKSRFNAKFKSQEKSLSEDEFLQFINALKHLEK